MAEYNFNEIEKNWQQFWAENKTFRAEDTSDKPKYYVLDMFPYPSGAGLHVGHPLGYIASDIVARYKRHKGFNVLHPMGYDSFGLPAEQYAIQTGQHPKITTEDNVATYRRQLDQIGFSFDWDREVRTSNADYYKWTQWIFIQLFNSWYNNESDKAEDISTLIAVFEKEGNGNVNANCDETEIFSAPDWASKSEEEQQTILLNYRLAYLSDTMVNWCPALGTVLANDEVKDGVSERGGHPVIQKKMQQWSMRITAYAERLLQGLDSVDWTDSLKDIQRNWIGKSKGASVLFSLEKHEEKIEVFTTRPDTIFGVTYMTLAPEHELVSQITTADQKDAVEAYVEASAKRSERDRMSDVKTISGVFTGAYAVHPFTGENIPIWLGDYVLASYGTGAVMAVPAHDSRDYAFAKHFGLEIKQVVEGGNIEEESFDAKEGIMMNSDFLNGLKVNKAIKQATYEIEQKGIGKGQTNYRLRDAVFGRQRYWGEPIPIYYKNNIPYAVDEADLPITLPEVDKYLPTEDGEPPLARATDWKYKGEYDYELSTMPGWAGSSWYFLRYMNPENTKEFVSKKAVDYWQQIDLYMGGAEHATGHLLYFRFWTKFLKDKGLIQFDEPAKKLINQGMIQGRSNFVYSIVWTQKLKDGTKLLHNKSGYISKAFSTLRGKELREFIFNHYKDRYELNSLDEILTVGISSHNVDVNIVENDVLDIEAFKADERFDAKNAEFILEGGKYICGVEVEKMSKSKWNVVNPDDLVEKYGADTLRMYEMFLGPLEQAKPWNTNGVDGVHKFLKKFWRLFENGVSEEKAIKEELKATHETIKKVEWDIENFSFNTSISQFMICTNKLSELKCNKREVLEPLVVCLSPYAPHIAEELWKQLGNNGSVTYAVFPEWKEEYLKEDNHKYPVSVNGKMRVMLELPIDMSIPDIQKEVLANEVVQKWLDGKEPKKMIVVPKKIVNVVI